MITGVILLMGACWSNKIKAVSPSNTGQFLSGLNEMIFLQILVPWLGSGNDYYWTGLMLLNLWIVLHA